MHEQDEIISSAIKSQEQGIALMERLIAVAQPNAVYSEPKTVGDQTVITASEVSVGMGFGFGVGGGADIETAEKARPAEDAEEESPGIGGGGGGGGVSWARPVALIIVGPQGVHIEPIVDATKVALAFLTTIGSMFFVLGRMRKADRRS